MPWQLTIAGDRTRNPAAAAQLDTDIEAHGLGHRVTVLGAVPPERIMELYRGVRRICARVAFRGIWNGACGSDRTGSRWCLPWRAQSPTQCPQELVYWCLRMMRPHWRGRSLSDQRSD
jgi:hypothetical protein